jgi:hypothetical protein
LLTTDGKIVFASTPFLTRESAKVLKNKWKEEFPGKPVELLFVKPESIDLIKE